MPPPLPRPRATWRSTSIRSGGWEPGNFQARFRETLLREFVAANQREKPPGAPLIQPLGVEGAEAALIGRFTEDKRAAHPRGDTRRRRGRHHRLHCHRRRAPR